MNRIRHLFHTKKNILSIYFTAGYPRLNDTIPIIQSLAKNGVDMIEIGMPFSDPLADGPTIQQSSEVALKNGMTIKFLFKQLENIREKLPAAQSGLPLILMGYLNPVLQFGFEKFCKASYRCSIDGLIIPDLPVVEYRKEYKKMFDKYELKKNFLITPQTSVDRIRAIDRISDGFIYVLSASGTTGNYADLHSRHAYYERLKAMKLKNPLLIGFGISDNGSYKTACSHANGAIIGSAFIRSLEKGKEIEKNAEQFVRNIRS